MEAVGTHMTYEELAQYIAQMTKEERKQPVQMMGPQVNYDQPIPLMYAIGIDSIKVYCHDEDNPEIAVDKTRGSVDNEHHPEHHVLLIEDNPFDVDGNFSFQMVEEGYIGDKTGKFYSEEEMRERHIGINPRVTKEEMLAWVREEAERQRELEDKIRKGVEPDML